MNRKAQKDTREEMATCVFWANLREESGSSNINEYHAAAVDQNCLNIRFTRFWEKSSLFVSIFLKINSVWTSPSWQQLTRFKEVIFWREWGVGDASFL